ncbi:PIP2-7 [Symbiodinium sp. KB8]|nr:PIP2-7 [Symbiodinium sp. KB8]
MMGSILGAAILCAIFPPELDMTKSLGANSVGLKWHWWNALIGEVFGTFLLVFVVLQTACNPKSQMNRSQACLAIGLAVFMAHCVLIPIDGCSINPTRSFGPALLSLSRLEAPKAVEPVATMLGEPALGEAISPKAAESVDASAGPGYWRSMWIFWLGPLLGAGLAAFVYKAMLLLDAVHEQHTLKHHPGYKRRQTLIEHFTPADPEAATGPVLLGSHGPREGKDAAARAESSA